MKGRIKKIFEKINLNWGTYDFHSNTHLDNFLILPYKSGRLDYLAPLDFDLAFEKKHFIEFKYRNNENKRSDIFDELLTSEKNNLLLQLAGFNTIVNISVSVLDLEDLKKCYVDFNVL